MEWMIDAQPVLADGGVRQTQTLVCTCRIQRMGCSDLSEFMLRG